MFLFFDLSQLRVWFYFFLNRRFKICLNLAEQIVQFSIFLLQLSTLVCFVVNSRLDRRFQMGNALLKFIDLFLKLCLGILKILYRSVLFWKTVFKPHLFFFQVVYFVLLSFLRFWHFLNSFVIFVDLLLKINHHIIFLCHLSRMTMAFGFKILDWLAKFHICIVNNSVKLQNFNDMICFLGFSQRFCSLFPTSQLPDIIIPFF